MDVLRKARFIPFYIKRNHSKTGLPNSALEEAYDILEREEAKNLFGKNILSRPYLPKQPTREDFYVANEKFTEAAELVQQKIEENSKLEEGMSQPEIELVGRFDVVDDYLDKVLSVLTIEAPPKTKIGGLWEEAMTVLSERGLEAAEKEVIPAITKMRNFASQREGFRAFFEEGKNLRGEYAGIFLLEPGRAEFVNGEWMVEGEPAYRTYNGQSSKELFSKLLDAMGFPVIQRKDKATASAMLSDFAQFDYDRHIEQLMTVIQSNNPEEFFFLFEENAFDDLESMLFELIDDAVEKHDEVVSPNEKLDSKDAEEIEKYLTAIEFVVAVFREREELGDLEQKVFEDVKEIDQPREFDANRRFPNLERAHDEWDVE